MEAIIENGMVTNIIVGHIDNSLPLEDNQPTLTDTQKIDGFTYDIQATKVVKVYNVIDKPLEELKTTKINEVKDIDEKAPVTINDITFNGGDSSASAIAGAVQLAQTLGETGVKLWDINNIIVVYTFEEAMTISAQIAKAYRDTQLAKYEKIAEINACTTIEELEGVTV